MVAKFDKKFHQLESKGAIYLYCVGVNSGTAALHLSHFFVIFRSFNSKSFIKFFYYFIYMIYYYYFLIATAASINYYPFLKFNFH